MGLEVMVQLESMHAVVALGDVVLNAELELEQLIVLPASSKQSAIVVNVVAKEVLAEVVETGVGVSVTLDGHVT